VPTTKADLREAHAHIPAYGREKAYLDLADCAGREDVLERVRRRHAERPSAGWILASGMRPAAWSDPRWPTRQELDAICADRPMLLGSFDHHSAAVNTAALAAAGFDPADPDPVDGVLERDGRGMATGVVLESAFSAARRAIPEPTRAQWRGLIKSALDDLASHGFTEVHDLLSPPLLGPMLAELHDAGELPVDVRLYSDWREVEDEAERARQYERPGVTLGGGKLFADGTLNARTAWMLTPYRSPVPGHPLGTPLTTAGELDAALARCAALGLELAVHAIGDAAVRACLDAKHRNRASRLRIEHCELIDVADVPRFAELGVTCSVQPCHLLYDTEVLRDQMSHRLDRVLPLRELLANGLQGGIDLIFGSDAPIVRPDPEDSIVAAVQRRRVGVSPSGNASSEPLAAAQAISEDAAWRAFGRAAAER
jgi:predicted amidohydrolase YtcJ